MCVILLKIVGNESEKKGHKKETHALGYAIVMFTYARHRTPTHLRASRAAFCPLFSVDAFFSLSLNCSLFSTLFGRVKHHIKQHFRFSSLHYLSLDQFTNNSMEFHMQYTHFKL